MNTLWIRRKNNKKKTAPLKLVLQAYMKAEFGNVVTEMSTAEFSELEQALLTILHSHRYKKAERCQDYEGIDFSIIRDVLYRYTLEARDRFFAGPFFSFLFSHFCAHGG